MTDLKSLLDTELQAWVGEQFEPHYRARQILDWVHKKRVKSIADMSNLPAALREKLAAQFAFAPLELVRKQGSADTTQKFLWRLSDGQMVESVLIPANPALYGERSDRHTLCVSSQVGCAYGCKFCASGLDGWKRNLDAGEIVGQVMAAEEHGGHKVNNIVFMGMGEPLANYDQLLKAIRIINAEWGVGIGARKMTVSTSGLVPQIRRLAEEPLQIRLAISLHGATNGTRDKIMPVNRKYPLEELLAACREYLRKKDQMITFEYILIDRVNDSPADADALGKICRNLKVKVNLIPYNSVDGLEWSRPPERAQIAFADKVRSYGVTATLRLEKGHDIDAACGQLRLKEMDVG
ncbi:23S rRNA (adenine(2503)-C(2))-methyltransferase RlmN [Oscillatoria laete-virens NRMC-F 0139]|nr:23S rRNA (adenine(2503)-C(2))-methyltransferase RlmN [Oscillatoria laete-virens]MDL5055062.1 23S rRNA (adenine(2503)-C(2))-methyltransferase RlmN [Oscillatoria laete-virens NRMC-F 0139]